MIHYICDIINHLFSFTERTYFFITRTRGVKSENIHISKKTGLHVLNAISRKRTPDIQIQGIKAFLVKLIQRIKYYLSNKNLNKRLNIMLVIKTFF